MASKQEWWEDDTAESMWACVDDIVGRQRFRLDQIVHHTRLYGDGELYRQGAYSTAGSSRPAASKGKPLSLNIVRNQVDTVVSKLALSKPGVEYLTVEGDFSLQEIAKQRKLFIDGVFTQSEFWQLRQRCLKNMALYGTGIGKAINLFGRCAFEYVFPGEVIVDESEALVQAPLNIFQEKPYDRQRAIAKWPHAKKEIERAQSPGSYHLGRSPSKDQVLIREGYHMHPEPGEPGVQIGAIQGKVLYRRAFTRAHQQLASNLVSVGPFFFWRWSEEPLGFFGSGLGEQLSGIQWEINQILKLIQNNVYLGANIKIFLERGSKIVDAEISNTLRGALVHYTGTPPQFHVHDVITNQVIQWLGDLIQRAYEISGVSQSSAQGQIPSGLTGSGRSQLVYQNIESKRFVSVQRNDEAAVRAAAQQAVELGQEILEQEGKYEVHAPARNWILEIDTKTALQDVGAMQVQSLPASQLPHDLASKVAFAEYLQQIGWASVEEAMEMADMPDTNKFLAMRLSPIKLVEKQLEKMLEQGEAVTPLPRQNLQISQQLGTFAYNHAVLMGYPEDRIDLLNNWLTTVERMLTPAQQDAGAQGAAAVDGSAPSSQVGPGGLPPVQPAPQTLMQ